MPSGSNLLDGNGVDARKQQNDRFDYEANRNYNEKQVT
jgi:hypothetical protein